MKLWLRALSLVFLAAIAIPVFTHSTENSTNTTTPKFALKGASTPYPGGLAPDFTLQDYQGNPHKLSDFRGKPVLINFWASWCGPCQSEMPELARASKIFNDRVQFLGVNLAARDSDAVSKALLQKYSVSYPNVLDKQSEVADRYQVLVIPTSLLIDANGKIIARFQGPITGAQIADWLKKIS